MKISDFIPPENVLLNLPASNKRDCLRALSDRAARWIELDGKLIFHTLLAREALGSTGLGDGVSRMLVSLRSSWLRPLCQA